MAAVTSATQVATVYNPTKNVDPRVLESSKQTVIKLICAIMTEWINTKMRNMTAKEKKADQPLAMEWVDRTVTDYSSKKATLSKADANAQQLYKDFVQDMLNTLQPLAYKTPPDNATPAAKYVFETVLPLIRTHTQFYVFMEAMAVPLVNEHIDYIDKIRAEETPKAADAQPTADTAVDIGSGIATKANTE